MPRVAEDVAGAGRDEQDGRQEHHGTELEQQIARLRSRHGEIEQRLHELERHLSLTSDEQLERAQLKKEKLWNKDRIVALTHLLQAA